MSTWDRRSFLAGAGLLAAAFGLPSAAWALDGLPDAEAPTDRQRALLREVCQLVIPATDTLGAGDVGAGDFVILALAHGLGGTRAPVDADFAPFRRSDGSVRHLAWLEATLDRQAGGDFAKAPQRAQVLATLDAAAFPPGPPPVAHSPWVAIKGLILTGYYTSEVGGEKELVYASVPGRWDPDLPLTPQTRAISNDWTAVDFG